jgi:hypothetical protein
MIKEGTTLMPLVNLQQQKKTFVLLDLNVPYEDNREIKTINKQ